MTKKWIVKLVVIAALIFGLSSQASASEPKVYWDGLLMVKGQVGKIKVIKPINLWKRDGNKLVFERVLKPGEQYRVYRYDNLFGGQYGLGGGYYITKMAGYVDYRTPSKKKLAELEAAYSGGGSTTKPIGNLSIGKITQQESKKIAPGVTETELSVASNRGKQKIYAVEYDGKTEKISLETALAKDQLYGFEPVSKQANNAKTPEKHVVAGINGDYFDKNGHPVDLMIQKGEIIATSQTPLDQLAVFGVTKEGKPLIGNPQLKISVQVNGQNAYWINSVNRTRSANHLVLYTPAFASSTRTNNLGTEVVVKTDSGQLNGHSVLTGTVVKVVENVGDEKLNSGEFVLSGHNLGSNYLKTMAVGDKIEVKADFASNDWNQVVEALSGRYHLVKNGSVVKQTVAGVHPRSAIGIKADGGIVTVVVDGRNALHSVGLSLAEMATVMKDLGAVQAFTFDGGGSSTMVVREHGNDSVSVVNKPSDGAERSVSNSLLFISKWMKGPLNQLVVNPKELTLFAGATYKDLGITVKGMDQFYNAVPVSQIAYSSPALKKNADGSYTASTSISNSEITVSSGNISSKIKVNLINTLDSIQVDEKDIMVENNTIYKIQPKGIYKGKTVISDPALFKWSVSPASLGTINNKGEFKAGSAKGTGTITVSHGKVSAKIAVTVGTPEPILIEGFENGIANYKASGARYKSVNVIQDPLSKTGKYSAKLSYDFTGTSGTSGAYIDAIKPIALKGHPKKIGMWVYGDGKGHWLRMQLKDGSGQEVQLDFTKNLNWTGWKYIEAAVPQNVKTPLVIEAPVRYMETSDTNKNSGAIFIDQIQAVYK